MSKWQFSFPPSRTCLWDKTPTGSPCELHLTRNGWLWVRISPPTLQLAVRHAKQSPRKLYDCFLIGTAWITEAEGIALEVDRFDPGRLTLSGSGLSPTTLIPGDVAIPSQVTVNSHPDAKHLPHNLATLKQSVEAVKQALSAHTTPLDPALLLSLRIHCTCSEEGRVDVECACVYPGLVIEAAPIKPIAIVQTALARNLSGPLSLSVIQGKVKHGYVTMETSRKLILLLHSDPKVTELPLIGIWVSGVSSVYYPVVWAACVAYTHSTTLTDRVWGEDGSFVTLVYLEGSSKPLFYQCTLNDNVNGQVTDCVAMASGEHSLQPSSSPPILSFELYPVQESTALHALLETVTASSVLTSSSEVDHRIRASPHRVAGDLVPLPSPQPTPTQVPPKLASDRELSMVSCLSLLDRGQSPSSTHTTPVTMHSSCDLSHDLSHDSSNQFLEDKENTPVNHSLTSNSGKRDSSCTQSDADLIVFPDKLGAMTPRSADTRKLLRQQEQQLRALQEQVNTLLLAQSQSPSLQSQSTAEASTSTGDSLYWPQPHPTPSTHSTRSTPSKTHTHPSVERDENSVCLSTVSGMSVRTATSLFSQNTSDLHLDLHSYAQSPSPPQSPGFGESASVFAGDDSDSADSAASLLFRDQQQFYQNMLSQVNALLKSEDDDTHSTGLRAPSTVGHTSLLSNTSSQPQRHSSDSSTVTEPLSTHHQSSQYSRATEQPSTESDVCNDTSRLSNCTSHCSHGDQLLEAPGSTQPVYLHPDVLQQQYSTEMSLLPVPRIVCPVVSNDSYGAGLYGRNSLGSTEYTLDENTQLADEIAVKYLGNKLPADMNTRHSSLLLPGGDGTIDNGSAHMSMATQQYLQRHCLLPTPGNKAPRNTLDEGGSPQDGHDNILNIRRLKTLPKLI